MHLLLPALLLHNTVISKSGLPPSLSCAEFWRLLHIPLMYISTINHTVIRLTTLEFPSSYCHYVDHAREPTAHTPRKSSANKEQHIEEVRQGVSWLLFWRIKIMKDNWQEWSLSYKASSLPFSRSPAWHATYMARTRAAHVQAYVNHMKRVLVKKRKLASQVRKPKIV